ncbi:hydantoinase/carbamoylase family amidase, partial [Phascolarctobacterium faecium]|uniref:hydantoinase/carbamoylase family amidase n=1 Tax=Phascolarctobacterium faecium TaxID=33025 RepID=UPI002FE3D7D0
EECTAFGMACFGVRVRGGEFKKQKPESIVHLTGGSLAECLQAAGLPHSALQDAAVGFQDLAAFVELHIEQGADLKERGLTCGAVTAIVGYDRLFLTLHGEANHAGTTSMRRRRDALAAAAEVILGVKELAEADDRFVATVGQLNVAPNAVNIVPGKVQLAIETRAADDRVLAEVRAKIMSLLERTASKSGVVITKENDFHVAAVPLSESVRKVIEQSAAECGVSFQAMPSWAGHDAQIFAASGVPTGMIFVPSINGVSHSKEESSDFQSVTQAVKVLEKTLKTLAEV